MDEKLTRKSQDALSASVRRAAGDGHPQVGPAHLLAALIEQADGTATPLLRAVGADPANALRRTQELLAQLPQVARAPASAPETSRPLPAPINTAATTAPQLIHALVTTAHR